MIKCMLMNLKCLEELDFYKKTYIKYNIDTNLDQEANNLLCYLKI